MIFPIITSAKYPGLAYDGTLTFAGVLQNYYSIKDFTDQNTGISSGWNNDTPLRRLSDYTNRILPTINRLFGPEKPMHEYVSSDFEAILDALERRFHYAQATVEHYRRLLMRVYKMGVAQGLYPDNIFWETAEDEDDPNKSEQLRAKALTRTRKSFSVQEEIRLLLWFTSLDPTNADGESLGLMLMFFLGIRDNEACGTSFGNIQLMPHHSDMALLTIGNTTGIGTNRLKAGGKSGNAPRQLALYKPIYQFLQARREWIEGEIDAGRIMLPPDIDSVDLLPIVCKGKHISERAMTADLSKAGRILFQNIGIEKSELAELQRILLSADFKEAVIDEKNPTTYLFRRNTATRLYHTGLDWETIQYWIAHDIESPSLRRNFFSDEEILYELGKQYHQHPLFLLFEEIMTRPSPIPNGVPIASEYYHLDGGNIQIIEIEANEPNTPIIITATSNSRFSITQTEKESSVPSGSLVSIAHPLQNAYQEALRTVLNELRAE